MAELDNLLSQIEDEGLRTQLKAQVDLLTRHIASLWVTVVCWHLARRPRLRHARLGLTGGQHGTRRSGSADPGHR